MNSGAGSDEGCAAGGGVAENAAAVAGALAELGIGEVLVDGVALRSRGGADLPGVIARAVEEKGEAVVVVVGGGRGEIVVGREGVRWRGCDEAVVGAMWRAVGRGGTKD